VACAAAPGGGGATGGGAPSPTSSVDFATTTTTATDASSSSPPTTTSSSSSSSSGARKATHGGRDASLLSMEEQERELRLVTSDLPRAEARLEMLALWVGAAVAFGGGIWYIQGAEKAQEFFAG